MIDRFGGQFYWLSNFETHEPITVFDLRAEEISGPSVEHVFQACKYDDPTQQLLVLKSIDPRTAKAMGRKYQARADWDARKMRKMYECLQAKFAIPKYRGLLLGTDNQFLVEGNNHGDEIWGVCNGNGTNWLGHLLMKVRSELRESA